MSNFDTKFNELHAKIGGVIAMLVAEFPEAAVRAREVIKGAEAAAVVEATVQADDARANAIATLISGAGQALAQAVSPNAEVEVESVDADVEDEPAEGL